MANRDSYEAFNSDPVQKKAVDKKASVRGNKVFDESTMSKGSAPGRKSSQNGASFFEEVMAFLILAVVFSSLLWQGLLSDQQMIIAILLLTPLCTLVLVQAVLRGERSQGHLPAPTPALSSATSLLMAIGAAISLLNAAHTHDALLGLSKYCALALVLLTAQALNRKIPFQEWLMNALVIAGVACAILGVDGILGSRMVSAVNAALSGGVQPEAGMAFLFDMVLGDRLASVFQYPNTTASFLFSAWLATVHLLVFRDRHSPGAKKKQLSKQAEAYLLYTASFILFASFLLTLSRGMFLVGAVAACTYIALVDKDRKWRCILIMCTSLFPGGAVALGMLPGSFLRQQPGIGIAVFTAAMIITSYIGTLVEGRHISSAGKRERKGMRKTILIDKKRITVPIIGIITLLLIVSVAALSWLWEAPFPIGQPGASLLRRIQISHQGAYQLEIQLSEPIDSSFAEAYISLQSQDDLQMRRNLYAPVLDVRLDSFQGQDRVKIPFSLAEGERYLLLSVSGGGLSAAQISKISILDADGGAVHPIRLFRRLIPERLVRQIEALLHPETAYQRFGFYFDAWKMFRDYPLTGIGERGWSYLYGRYQDFRYIANDPHSFGVQLMVSFGAWGLLALAGLVFSLGKAFHRYLRQKEPDQLVLITIAGTMLAHSLIDVDFTYYGMILVFFLFWALLDTEPSAKGYTRKSRKSRKYIAVASVLALSIVAMYFPITFRSAWSYARASAAAGSAHEHNLAVQFAHDAMRRDPFMPEYKAECLRQQAIWLSHDGIPLQDNRALIEATERQGQYSIRTWRYLTEHYLLIGECEEADRASRALVACSPLRADLWEERFMVIDSIIAATADGSTEEFSEWLGKGLCLPDEIHFFNENKIGEVLITDQMQGYLDRWHHMRNDLFAAISY